ncbi:hypothetical protein SAMN02910436_02964 [Ruminococcaceae bacterium P7]|nr:hypothetical protein SAMN02910436_02964 [Ruminococcaceae bacterium P7]
MVYVMVRENSPKLKAMYMKANLLMESRTDTASRNTQTATATRVCSKTVNVMDEENILMLTAK